MGIGETFAEAFAKAQLGANVKLPLTGNVFISVRDADKKHVVIAAEKLYKAGFGILATGGTALFLEEKEFRYGASTRCWRGVRISLMPSRTERSSWCLTPPMALRQWLILFQSGESP